MKDPGVTIQQAYYTKLTSPAITVAVKNIPVYSDMAPAKTNRPYIVLGEQTLSDESDKTGFQTQLTQSVSVYTLFDGDRGSKKLANDIANEVMKRIRNRQFQVTGSDFNSITATLDSSASVVTSTSTQTIISKQLRFRHIIQEF
jgi:hypothetical protein